MTRPWQVFCSRVCRARWNYTRTGGCFYCGETILGGGCRHQVGTLTDPRSFRGETEVLACDDCHGVAGRHLDRPLEFRLNALMGHYTEKYSLDKRAVVWDEDEIEELGQALRQRIKAKLAKRHHAERNYAYARAVLHEVQRAPKKSEQEGSAK